jgi:hypothetical protein
MSGITRATYSSPAPAQTPTGKILKPPEFLPEIRDQLWDGMGIAADNKDPLLNA